MSTQVKWRRGTTEESDAFTGALAEITVDTDEKTLRVHDNVTPGGSPLANKKYVTKAQEELLPPGSQICPRSGYLANGMTVPAGTTHLRVLVDGEPTILVAWDALTLPATVTSVPISGNGLGGYDVTTDQGTFEFVTPFKYDLRLDGDVAGWGGDFTGVDLSTASIQAAIDYQGSYAKIKMVGDYKSGNFTFSGVQILIDIQGTLTLTETLEMKSGWHINGYYPSSNVQFSIGPKSSILSDTGTDTTIRVNGTANKSIKGIAIRGCDGLGLHLDQGALIELEDVDISCNDVSTSAPMKVSSFFWVYLKKCVFFCAPSQANGLGYSVLLEHKLAIDSYTGLVFFEDCKFVFFGVKMEYTSNTSLNRNINFKNCEYESGWNDFLTIDISSNSTDVAQLSLDNCLLADPKISGLSLINNIGESSPVSISIKNADTFENVISPTSNKLRAVNIEPTLGYLTDSTNGMNIDLPEGSVRSAVSFTDAFKGRNISYDLSSFVSKYDTIDSKQDGNFSVIGSATLTQGLDAPDGSPTATRAEFADTNTSQISLCNATYPLEVGDWIMGCVWIKPINSTDKKAPRMLLVSGSGDLEFESESSLSTNNLQLNLLHDSNNAFRGWRLLTFKARVSASDGVGNKFCYLRAFGTIDCDWWMPTVYIVKGDSFNNPDIEKFEESLGVTLNGTKSGDFVVPPYSRLKLAGSGGRLYSSSAVPSSGNWLVGDIIFNTTTVAGGSPGWYCTVSGIGGSTAVFKELAVISA